MVHTSTEHEVLAVVFQVGPPAGAATAPGATAAHQTRTTPKTTSEEHTA